MRIPTYTLGAAGWVAATLVPAAATALLVSFGANSTTAGLVFLALVVWFAAQAGIGRAIYVVLLCAVAFDFYFLPPLRTLQIVGVQQWVAMVCFLVSCAVVGRVAEMARRQTQQAQERRADMERLYVLSQEMMLQEDAAALLRDLPRILSEVFSLEAVALYIRDREQFHFSTADLPMSIQDSLRAASESHEPVMTVPGGFQVVKLALGLGPLGALGVRPPQLSQEAAAALRAQVSIALARASAIETSVRMEASREGERLRVALIDSLTHELRTPLTAIRAAATTLMDGRGLDEAARQDLAALVDEESAHLDLLIGKAVEMAEVDAHMVQVSAGKHRSRPFLEFAAEESRRVLAAHRVVIAVEEPDTPAWFDVHLLGRVMRHLLENAARFTPPGERILLGSRRINGRLEFRVDDDGPGVDPAEAPFLFEKFYRGKKSIGKLKGSGMGLAIAKAIVTAHGGGIEITRGSGRGACIRFWVPLVEEDPAKAAEELDTAD